MSQGGTPFPAVLAPYDPLTGPAKAALWVGCGLFAAQAALHGCRTLCVSASARSRQHELLAVAATACAALCYYSMACGISQASYAAVGGLSRIYFHMLYLERGFCVSLVFLNTSAMARERRASLVALVSMWLAAVGALYMGNFVSGPQRTGFLVASVAFLVPVGCTTVCAMGERLRMSQLQTSYRFLSTWCMVCCAGYQIVYFVCEVVYILDTETEILLYMLLDFCIIGVSSIIICCAGADLEVGLLPAQEAELSLYPGPHNFGFYPNPDFYNDNL